MHLIIQTKPEDSVAEVVQRLKGGTSRVIRKEYPELEEFLWGDSFWADGYFAETVGNVDLRDGTLGGKAEQLVNQFTHTVTANLTSEEG